MEGGRQIDRYRERCLKNHVKIYLDTLLHRALATDSATSLRKWSPQARSTQHLASQWNRAILTYLTAFFLGFRRLSTGSLAIEGSSLTLDFLRRRAPTRKKGRCMGLNAFREAIRVITLVAHD